VALLLLRHYYAYIPHQAVILVKLYPALVNAVLLGTFSFSLLKPPTVIERFARLQHPNPPQRVIDYARAVTKVWCVFFILNGSAAVVTALWGSDAVWALYNGLIAYVLMGSLMGIEWLVRRRAHLYEPA
jgi:uncharacterized membrane protein